jgi:hypothetical protein
VEWSLKGIPMRDRVRLGLAAVLIVLVSLIAWATLRISDHRARIDRCLAETPSMTEDLCERMDDIGRLR